MNAEQFQLIKAPMFCLLMPIRSCLVCSENGYREFGMKLDSSFALFSVAVHGSRIFFCNRLVDYVSETRMCVASLVIRFRLICSTEGFLILSETIFIFMCIIFFCLITIAIHHPRVKTITITNGFIPLL